MDVIKKMNLPNKLTCLRVLLIPFYVVFQLNSPQVPWMKYVALADKLLVCSALVCLVDQHFLPSWAVILIIAREFAISAFRLIASDNGVVIAASYWGKFKTVSQMILIVLGILNVPQLSVLTTMFLWIAVILTVVSLVDYLIKNKAVLGGDI